MYVSICGGVSEFPFQIYVILAGLWMSVINLDFCACRQKQLNIINSNWSGNCQLDPHWKVK